MRTTAVRCEQARRLGRRRARRGAGLSCPHAGRPPRHRPAACLQRIKSSNEITRTGSPRSCMAIASASMSSNPWVPVGRQTTSWPSVPRQQVEDRLVGDERAVEGRPQSRRVLIDVDACVQVVQRNGEPLRVAGRPRRADVHVAGAADGPVGPRGDPAHQDEPDSVAVEDLELRCRTERGRVSHAATPCAVEHVEGTRQRLLPAAARRCDGLLAASDRCSGFG